MTKIRFINNNQAPLGEIHASQKTHKDLVEILQHMVRKLDASKELAHAARSCEDIEVKVALDKYNEAECYLTVK